MILLGHLGALALNTNILIRSLDLSENDPIGRYCNAISGLAVSAPSLDQIQPANPCLGQLAVDPRTDLEKRLLKYLVVVFKIVEHPDQEIISGNPLVFRQRSLTAGR